MLSRTLASGVMLFAVTGLSGVALIDEFRGGAAAEPAVIDAEIAVITPEAPIAPAAVPVTPPTRVVETAGFPVTPSAPAATEVAAVAPQPTVTVNGQPIGSTWSPVATEVAAPAPATVAATEDLIAPKPIARPEGLTLPTVAAATPAGTLVPPANVPVTPDIDYEAITASAFPDQNDIETPVAPWGGVTQTWGNAPVPPQPVPMPAPQGQQLVGPVGVVGGFMTWEERQRLNGGPSPEQQGLVQVVGPDGQALWVYPDQVGQFNAAPRPVQQPFGLFFE